MNTGDSKLMFDRDSVLGDDGFDIDAAAESARRLHALLTDKNGRGMGMWYLAVGSVMRELVNNMNWTEGPW